MKTPRRQLSMHEPAIFCIRIQGQLDQKWSDYFGAESLAVETDPAGNTITIIHTEPIDQGGLVGVINQLNMLGIPVISIEGSQIG